LYLLRISFGCERVRRSWPAVLTLLFSMVICGCSVVRVAVEGSVQDRVFDAIDKVRPALVHLEPVREYYERGERKGMPLTGSGVIISPDGYLLTNSHVAERTKEIRCTLFNKKEVYAQVIGTDPYTDIAVLQLDPAEVGDELPYAEIGDSDKLNVGEQVMAMGSPHGLSRSVSVGALSATDRYFPSDGGEAGSPYHLWIQTDAAINPGNSGGPLVNLEGKVIGINSRKVLGADNLGFAVPINVAKAVADQIIADGKVTRSWIGVELQELETIAREDPMEGVLVGGVSENSPAERAGIISGDILVSFDGRPLSAQFEEDLVVVRNLIASTPVDKRVVVELMRDGKQEQVELVTKEKGKFETDDIECEQWGCTVREMTESLSRRHKLEGRIGVYVSGVQVGGAAANARLAQGDIILYVEGEKINNSDEFGTIYDKLEEERKELVLLRVKRGALFRYVLIEPRYGDGDDSTAETEQ
jgi:serine protease Do